MFGEGGTLGRQNTREVVLVPRLRAALRKLNREAPPEAIEQAVDELTRDRLFQAPAKLPGREEELERLRQQYNLPRAGMI